MDKVVKVVPTLLRQRNNRKGHTLAEFALIFAFVSMLFVVFMAESKIQLRSVYLSIASVISVARATI